MGAPNGGYSTLHMIPPVWSKPRLTQVRPAAFQEVHALDEFITLKQRQISRQIHVTKNKGAMDETIWLKLYLTNFLKSDRSGATSLPFWPNDVLVPYCRDLGVRTPEAPTTNENYSHSARTISLQ